MPKGLIKVTTRLEDTEYSRYPTVIDITMGEFAFSDFYPIHSDSFATCLGVVVGAVDGYGVCLGHLDPLADDGQTGALYGRTLDRMIDTVLRNAATAKVDVLFFKDGFRAVEKYRLNEYVALRHEAYLRDVVDLTEGEVGHRYTEVVAMPSAFHSTVVCLKPAAADWDWETGKRVLRAATERSGNQEAMLLGRAREVTFALSGVRETVTGEINPEPRSGILSFLGL